ncbi:MAG: hypothetical protein AB7S26_37905 [Sandaracinaceae bacterium]
MRDPLEELVGAYVDEVDRGAPRPDATRSRLLRSVHRRHARRRWLLGAGVVLALLATNATTWAWSTGALARLSLGDAAIARSDVPADVPAAPREPRVDVPPDTASRVVVAEREPTAPLASEPPARSVERAPEVTQRRPARAAEAPRAEEPGDVIETASADPPDSADALARAIDAIDGTAVDGAERRDFERAHALHFGDGTAAEALTAWDTYLARYPLGRFVPEARFNRAIALLHDGRREEARIALAAIADGRYGGSHREDARRLVEAIDEGRVRTP